MRVYASNTNSSRRVQHTKFGEKLVKIGLVGFESFSRMMVFDRSLMLDEDKWR